jgi:hypothetical protein
MGKLYAHEIDANYFCEIKFSTTFALKKLERLVFLVVENW